MTGGVLRWSCSSQPFGGRFKLGRSRNDKLKAVKDALRVLRYPEIARLEHELADLRQRPRPRPPGPNRFSARL